MYEPKIVGFLCTWCSYTGADLAGTSRLKSPWNIKTVRVPCSGRVSPELIMRAFDVGADGVLVLGCHIGECHYDTGNHRTAKRIPILNAMMSFAGLEPERLHLDWVSASEAERYAKLVTEFTNQVRDLGPINWRVNQDEWQSIAQEEIKSLHEVEDIGKDWADQDRIEQIQSGIQNKAHELLESNQVDCVIGYEQGPRGRIRPIFIFEPDQTKRLVWNQNCTHNLTTYLHDKLRSIQKNENPYRVAIVVKPCDSKSINVQIAEKRYNRDQLHVIGLACDGIHKGAGYGLSTGEYQSRCLGCSDRSPVVYDTLLGDPDSIKPDIHNIDENLAILDAMTPHERMDFWLNHFDRCIRCYACRQVCPNCDCPICLYERDDSLWVGFNIELNEKRTFHLGRAFHLAGRCVGCDECERVCPMKIPISLLNRKLVKEVKTVLGHKTGMAPVPSPITTILEVQEGKL